MIPSAAGVVTALRPESRSLTRHSRAPVSGNTRVMVSGIGRENAYRAACRLVDDGARALVSWGCAGALSSELAAGDLCLPGTILSVDGRGLDVDTGWRDRVQRALGSGFHVRTAPLLGSDRLAVAPAYKAELARRFANAIAVDMESAGVATAATERGVPFLVVRAIVDTRAVTLPPSVIRAVESKGGVRLPRMLAHALMHPRELPAHFALAAGFGAALATLRRAARLLGAGLAFEDPPAIGIGH